MSPTRFSSVRSKSGSTTTVRRTPFRDDSSLVALRYEKTVPAEPPIPLPPRNPSRIPIRTPSTRSPAPSSPSPSLYAASLSSFSHSPVVVAPPRSPLPTIAPPTEQHPALRTPVPKPEKLALEGWKRDSGHAPTSNSSAAIREEDCEDGSCSDVESPSPWTARIDALVKKGILSSTVQHVEHSRQEGRASSTFRRSMSKGSVGSSRPTAATACSSPLMSCNTMTTASSEQLVSEQSLPSSPKMKRLMKRFSVRSSSSTASAKAGKLPVLISERSAVNTTPIMHTEPLMRGSPQAPASTSQQPPPPTRSPINVEPASPQSWASPKSFPETSPPPAPSSPVDPDLLFNPLGLCIPTDSLLEDDFMASLSFSKRGSIMFGGRRVNALGLDGNNDANVEVNTTFVPSSPAEPDTVVSTDSNGVVDDGASSTTPSKLLPPPDIRVLTADIEKESQKVRSLYGVGETMHWEDGARHSFCEHLEPTPEVAAEDDENDSFQAPHVLAWGTPRSASSFSHRADSGRRETELAGGLEDWEDVDGATVDRYGFINAPRAMPKICTPTELRSAQFSPRRRNVLQKRDPMGFSSPLSGRTPSRKVSTRSLNTQTSEISMTSMRSSRSVLRQATNMLPHNRDRRWMDEAGDMLTVNANLQDEVEEANVEKISDSLKRKEWERSEKWRKMAKVGRKADQGQGHGMDFEFDVNNPKLIERTWKGIPDRWRAVAWWSFLATSAKEHEGMASEEQIIATFHRLLLLGSPDDVQIDLDVPRTINRHIMFRKRYRGGQRLLFRVLHALSIYFPETGYVQGMASLAATLLCYYDEEKCFVMLVRMWQLRGLDRLYRPGFAGLMEALREFDDTWLHKDVAKKLSELGVDITAYGTRWYLTLFNLSIPFPAQLRVWDVFILLGNCDFEPAVFGPQTSKAEDNIPAVVGGLDVLHATSAALIQALREVLLDSDFENAMKGLTAWIPIKDEDLLMKVAKAEWKAHQNRKKT